MLAAFPPGSLVHHQSRRDADEQLNRDNRFSDVVDAPAAKVRRRLSPSVMAVTIMRDISAMCGLALIKRQASSPLRSGITRSIRIRSKVCSSEHTLSPGTQTEAPSVESIAMVSVNPA